MLKTLFFLSEFICRKGKFSFRFSQEIFLEKQVAKQILWMSLLFLAPSLTGLDKSFSQTGLASAKKGLEKQNIEQKIEKRLREPKKTDFSVLNRQLERRIRQSGIDRKKLGIYIGLLGQQSASSYKSPVFISVNGKKLFVPASLTKVATAVTALKKMGLKKRFTTRLVSKTEPSLKILKGDLFLVGGGDSAFTSESMWQLVNHFLRSGVKEIKGKIVVDDSLFSKERYPKGRAMFRVNRAYDAPVGAMSFNWNVSNVYVKPSKVLGQPAQIHVGPYSKYYEIKNKTQTVAGRKRKIHVSSFKLVKSSGEAQERLIVRGTVGKKSSEKIYYQKVEDPDIWSGYNLKWFLESRGVKVSGKVVAGVAPKNHVVLAEQESRPLSFFVYQMMKYSNNLIAEILTRHLSLGSQKKGDDQAGIIEIEKYLRSIGLEKKKDFLIRSASGLSQKNRFKPQALFRILQEISRDSRVYPEFLHALPISGVDGSLEKRMSRPAATHWVRAKTGSLKGVVGLAGVVQRGPPLGFVFVFNGDPGEVSAAESLFSKISADLANYIP